MRVNWSDRALKRLRGIQRYIAIDNPSSAEALVQRVLDRAEVLAEHPHIGRKVPEYNLPDLREVSERPYRIIYQVDADQDRVDILTVKHYRQRLPTYLPDL